MTAQDVLAMAICGLAFAWLVPWSFCRRSIGLSALAASESIRQYPQQCAELAGSDNLKQAQASGSA